MSSEKRKQEKIDIIIKRENENMFTGKTFIKKC